MKKIALLLLCSLIIYTSKAQIQVKLIITVPGLSADSSVYLTGSLAQTGGWDPAKVKMEYIGSDTWQKLIVLNTPASFEYKFTRGSWAKEAANPDGNALPNFVADVKRDTVINYKILNWTNAANKPALKGQITGLVKYHKGIKYEGLKDRDIIVWLPPGYDQNSSKRYSVLYMQDGQNIVDPATSTFGTDWQIDEAADSLINAKAIDPVIIVGIYNTSDRMKEYMPGGLSKSYISLIVNEIKPFVDRTYRTLPDAKHTFAGGSSAGGILAFMLVWEHPDKFSKAICMSPAFKIENWDYVKTVSASTKRKNVFFYIDNGGIALEASLQPGIDDMINALNAKGYKAGKDFIFIQDLKASHTESAWAKRIPGALKLILNK